MTEMIDKNSQQGKGVIPLSYDINQLELAHK